MRRVSELYGRHIGADIYIVGTGPSLRVFPKEFLQGRITIGLNMAWKSVSVKYAITHVLDLNIPEFIRDESRRPEITWVVTRRKVSGLPRDQRVHAEKHFYGFEIDGQPNTAPDHEPSNTGRIPEWLDRPCSDFLYINSSISQTAINLAANLGAKNVILVGCDNCSLGGDHHAHPQHTRWNGADPDYRYRQYYEGLLEVRAAMRRRGVNLISMNPFVSLGHYQEDFRQLCQEVNQPEQLPPPVNLTMSRPKPTTKAWLWTQGMMNRFRRRVGG